jgi:hypothetical protein
MNEVEISHYIMTTFEGVDVVVASGDSFFFYNPDGSVPPNHKFPFVTLVTSDINDQFSNLNRPSIFRLNIGITKQTFRTLFAKQDNAAESNDVFSNYDFRALDQVMPHPVYGRMYWVCILNPTKATFETTVSPLLVEAYKLAVGKYKGPATLKPDQS